MAGYNEDSSKLQRPAVKLNLLQAYRGLAAIAVLLFHVQLIAERRIGATFLGGVFTEGRLGVDFFFVLSGFIISYVHAADFGNRQIVPRYLTKRVVRIYPLVMVLTLAKLSLMLALPSLVGEHQLDASLIVRSLFLIPQKPIPILPMAWTLTHEMLFYVLFAMGLYFGRKYWNRFQLLWAGSIIVVSYLMERTGHPDEINLAARFLFHPHNLQFLMGCFIADRCLSQPIRSSHVCWSLLITAIIAIAKVNYLWDVHGKLESCLAWGAVFTLVVWVSANWEWHHSAHVPRFWQFLGDASYSIYLVNTPIIAASCVVASRWIAPDRLAMQAILIVTTLVCIGCGILCYQLVERPLAKLFRPMVARQLEQPRKR